MFVTCHITFGQLSNFVGASLEVTRTIRNNKLHFTWGCFNLLYKKKEKGPETDFLFLKMIPTFFKSILILIITSLAIRYSQNVFRGFSILMCIGVQVFFWWLFFFYFYSFSRVWLALALASVWPKNGEKLCLFFRSRPPQWN